MAVSDRTEIGSICILASGVLEVRTDRVIMDGTDEIARRYNRFVATPDMDPTTLPPKVRAVANLVWTAQVKADWIAAHPLGQGL